MTRACARIASLPVVVLLAAACGSGDQAPSQPSPAPPAPAASWFEDATERLGLDFRHDPGLDGSWFMPQVMGAGAALLDHDGDGDLDVYLIDGVGPNRLYSQRDDGTFEDATDVSGLGDTGFGMGVAVGDVDGDARPDVFVTNHGRNALYRNDGEGRFTDVTAAAGVGDERWASSAAFFDLDLDGDLDLYVVNYLHHPEPVVCTDNAGRPDFCSPSSSSPVRDLLYRNRGDGTFEDVTMESGIGAVAGRGLGVVCDDFDGDGWNDAYVANDGEANFLFRNRGDGTFEEIALMSGVALDAFGAGEASMGVAVGDPDGDGDPDLFMTHLANESNTFYRNDGARGFVDVTAARGLGSVSVPFTGFGTAFFDHDNDGRLDLAMVNGAVTRRREALVDEAVVGPLAWYAEPNKLFHDRGASAFEDAGPEGGAFCRDIEVSRGLALGDVNGDGGLDLLVSNCGGPARLYLNAAPDRGHWLSVEARHGEPARHAYGARVAVTAGGRTLYRTVNPGQSYASSSDPRVHFGLGESSTIDSMEIRWPGGRVTKHVVDEVDRVLTIRVTPASEQRP